MAQVFPSLTATIAENDTPKQKKTVSNNFVPNGTPSQPWTNCRKRFEYQGISLVKETKEILKRQARVATLIAWYNPRIPRITPKSIGEGASSLLGGWPGSPKNVSCSRATPRLHQCNSGVALEQETFSGLPGHPPKRLLAPSPIDLGAIRGIWGLYQAIRVAKQGKIRVGGGWREERRTDKLENA